MAKQPDNRQPLGAVKKQLTADDASQIRAIARIFADIAKKDRDAIVKAIKRRGAYLATLDAERLNNVIDMYQDQADRFVDLFDIK